ncbi:hypothetical protein QQ045_016496 [Rhodiola kirilowii]
MAAVCPNPPWEPPDDRNYLLLCVDNDLVLSKPTAIGTPRLGMGSSNSDIDLEDLALDSDSTSPIEKLVKYGMSNLDEGLFMGESLLKEMEGLFKYKDVMLDDESKQETPAVVCFGEKQSFIGTAGAASTMITPKNAISQIKRLIGRQFSDPELQKNLAGFPFCVKEGQDGYPLINVQYLGETRSFTPTQLLGMVLSILKGIAEKNLGAAVVDCSTIAGLHPLHLIHETTATALTYGICKTDLPESDPLKILSHAFDRYLGGRNFDETLFQHFAACEKVKKVLNANPAAPLNIECLMDEKDVKGFIKREEFEEICVPILERVKKPLEEAISGAGLSGTKMARRIGGVDEHTIIFMEYEFEKKNIGAILVFDPGGGIILGAASGIAYPRMQGSVVYYGHTKSANKSYELRGHDFSLSQLASSSYAKHLIALAPAATSHWICHLTNLHVATGDNASAQQFCLSEAMSIPSSVPVIPK